MFKFTRKTKFDRIIEAFEGTPEGKQMLARIENEELAHRQQLIEQIAEAARERDRTVPKLRDAEAEARKAEEETLERYREACTAHRSAHGAVITASGHFSLQIEKYRGELERSAPECLIEFIGELGDAFQELRAHGAIGAPSGWPDGFRRIEAEARELQYQAHTEDETRRQVAALRARLKDLQRPAPEDAKGKPLLRRGLDLVSGAEKKRAG